MKRKKLDHIGANNMRELVTKLNEKKVRKEHIVQILETRSGCIAVYEK